MKLDEPRLGLALGGGAARGLAHLGVLQVFEREGLRADVIVGTSFGALAGAAVAARRFDVEACIRDVIGYVHGEEFRRSQISFFRRRRDIESTGLLWSLRDVIKRGVYYGFSLTRASIVPAEEFRASIDAAVPDVRIEDLPVRFAAVAADLQTGEEVVVDRGSLRLAVQASCAIPGLMPPVDVGGGRMLIDGGWVDKVPAEPTRALGAEVVIAVDVSDDLADTRGLTTGLNVMMRGDAIKSHRLKVIQLTRADLVISVPLAHVHWADFPAAAEIIDAGRRAAEAALPAVQEKMREKGGWGRILDKSTAALSEKLGVRKRRRRPHVNRVEARRPLANPPARIEPPREDGEDAPEEPGTNPS